MMDGLPELARRLAELDAEPGDLQWSNASGTDFIYAIIPEPDGALSAGDDPPAAGGPCADIAHFIKVVERITNTSITGTGVTSDIHILPCVSAAAADVLVKDCHLLARLADAVP